MQHPFFFGLPPPLTPPTRGGEKRFLPLSHTSDPASHHNVRRGRLTYRRRKWEWGRSGGVAELLPKLLNTIFFGNIVTAQVKKDEENLFARKEMAGNSS